MAVEKSHLMLIDGRFVTGEAGTRPVINPANGKVFVDVPEASPDQARQAIEAARKAQKAWGLKSPLARAAIMKRIAVLIRQNTRHLAEVVVREQGKPINEAMGEVGGAAEFFDYYAEFARRIQGEILPSDYAGEQVWIQRVPVGVVAAIIPWNYPSALVSRKVAPAMIAGDTIVLKPHEDTPLSALEMARIFVEAGVPDGVVNIITGRGETIGEVLCTEPGVDLITMTGSVPTGKRIMANASRNLTPVSLELGGKAPFIVLADADLDLAVRSAATSRYMNCGQVCICNERTLVHRSIYDQFVTRFVEFSKSLVVGDPMQANTDIGPKVSREELEKVEVVLAEAVAGGAKLALAGGRPAKAPIDGGYWLNPTVLTDVTPDMPIMTREIFGPVVPIMPFDTFEEAVSIANTSRYGLSAYLFTNDLGRIMKAVNEVSFGEIYVNRIGPEMLQGFHVGFRESGLGGDDGVHGLESYMRKKTVYVNYSGAATAALMPYGR
ncbi:MULTISPECIES: aldehyde dehydrogenase [unclassified Mesorhizobium]|uniref:aldehyde dehydrogenase n=1 Tax=unclassified Mesorhizobium TaxID=325217 RepID=UPI0011297B24|nr:MULTISPECIES: aldehyde dehydrogenase [unclassified Mesorhizobium]TPK63480.1 aldehyde dehydrogenase [Mesorhizobium sp. B2-5-1]TPM58816.1 aldehyde dehydrogenase [Mesorhizobium sp. B2-1-9]TPM79711.1 aldehyde dehydrogenase [Mesorhizobium sp. B2-1-4]TPN09612.1 aldehyde dehydrogenase [Mesorhizobium sp. B2-1-2]UCI13199.1 aldehyde dehydrogenase [Mesorhizobium sp. B2-1-1]